MAQQFVRTRQISLVLDRTTGEAPVAVSKAAATPEDLGISSRQNTLFVERYIKNLKCRCRIKSLPFVPAPMPPLGVTDNEKLQAIVENEANNPHKLIQMLIKESDSLLAIWGEIASIYLLNRNQGYNVRLSLYFAEGDILELDDKGIFAIRVVPDGYGVLSGEDYLHIYGLHKEIVTVVPKEVGPMNFTHKRETIPAGTVKKIVNSNPDRRYLLVNNIVPFNQTGTVWIQEGTVGHADRLGGPLYERGSFEWNWSFLETPRTSSFWAYAESDAEVTVVEGV
jgi:hypothetical protein